MEGGGGTQPPPRIGNTWAQGARGLHGGQPWRGLLCLPHPSGHEGRAGMAALVLRPPHSLDLMQLYTHVSENLPPYARPRFLRLQVTSHSPRSPSPHISSLHISTPCINFGSLMAPKLYKGAPNVIHSTKRKNTEIYALHPTSSLIPAAFWPGSFSSLSPPPLNLDLALPFPRLAP